MKVVLTGATGFVGGALARRLAAVERAWQQGRTAAGLRVLHVSSAGVLGPEHPDTALSLNNLGVLCYHEGDRAAAVGYIRRALAIWERVLGPNHPQTAQARADLAFLLSDDEESNTDNTD